MTVRLPERIKDLAGFFLFAIAISWMFFIPAATIVPEDFQIIFIILGAFGPLLSALLIIRFRSGKQVLRTWLRSVFRIRVPVWIYLLGAFGIPLVYAGLQYLIYRILGGRADFSNAIPWYLYLAYLLPTALLSGGNEEPGWRGFALPGLLRHLHPIVASLILGFFHAAWHLPLLGHYGTSFGWYLFNLIPLTFLLNWFYLSSRGSVLPVMLLHASTNVIGEFIPTPTPVLGGASNFMALRGIVYWILAILLIITTRGWLGWKPTADFPGDGPAPAQQAGGLQ